MQMQNADPAGPGKGGKPTGELNPYARPTHLAEDGAASPDRAPAKNVGLARRLAGGAIIVNGVLLLLDFAFNPDGSPDWLRQVRLIPAMIDLVIGVTLVLGIPKLVTLAIVRAVLGLTAGIALQQRAGGPFFAILQLTFAGSLLGLLVREAGRTRMVIAAALAGIASAVQVLLLAGGLAGWYPLAVTILTMSGDIEPSPVALVEGRSAPYEITFPEGRWYERTPVAVAKSGGRTDRWFLRPDRDAAVMIVAEKVPGSSLSTDAYAEAVIDSARTETPGLELVSKQRLARYPENGRLLVLRGPSSRVVYEYRYAFVTVYERGYHVVACASLDAVPSLDAELRSIIDSFRLPGDVLDAVPPGVDPTPIKTVVGHKDAYSFAVPGDRWRLRLREDIERNNPNIDQWLSCADLDAHVWTVVERSEGLLEPRWFVEAVIAMRKKDTSRFEVVEREPWGRFPENGTRLHISVQRDSQDLEYEFGLWVNGNRAYQVVAVAPKKTYPAAREAMIAAIDSFVPAP